MYHCASFMLMAQCWASFSLLDVVTTAVFDDVSCKGAGPLLD